MGALHPHPSIAGLASLELPSPADHRRASAQPGIGPSDTAGTVVIEPRSDPQAYGTAVRPRSQDRELHARCLRLGQADTGGAFGRRETDQLDDAGVAGRNEIDGDLDLAEGDIERIWSAGAAHPCREVRHASNVGPASKRDRRVEAEKPLNNGSTTAGNAWLRAPGSGIPRPARP